MGREGIIYISKLRYDSKRVVSRTCHLMTNTIGSGKSRWHRRVDLQVRVVNDYCQLIKHWSDAEAQFGYTMKRNDKML